MKPRRPDDEFDRQIDLDRSEWRHEGEREPFWGVNARFFAIFFTYAMMVWWLVMHFIHPIVRQLVSQLLH